MIFNEINHSYTEGEINYTPVSNYIKRFIPEFLAGIIAEKTAKKEGRTAEEVLEEWRINAEISTLYGNSVHRAIEMFVNYKKTTKIPHLLKMVEKFAEKYTGIYKSETIAKDDELKIAGTIDLIEKLGNKHINILDIKTNYEMDKKGNGKLLPPFQDLENNKINKYRLQLSLYKELCERNGLTVDNLFLLHWNGEDIIEIPLIPLEMKDCLNNNYKKKIIKI